MKIVLGFGSNLGDREQYINSAYKLLEERLGELINKSSLIETLPWGFESKNSFINSAALFETKATPHQALTICNEIEKELGRVRTEQGYQNRTIDIDILFYENQIINSPTLIIPHPLILERDFVLIPLKEIIPELIHPLIQKKIKEI
ncbi:MAG: 2-amino-4-hydroxy-6-hydroxymethyldihydropteridine diphosphokinase [Bacteroidales bacterium]|nr:2-amino-4-hydroxy-6-hydroxymethyldihydropteridine diphosphokinase [Bacteroidales bacterium]MDD4683855.1 2-amino-4-hydroxy-6-hydroxymethyldihydropteridine diphosphokinase [Bacteroidales bacterium]